MGNAQHRFVVFSNDRKNYVTFESSASVSEILKTAGEGLGYSGYKLVLDNTGKWMQNDEVLRAQMNDWQPLVLLKPFEQWQPRENNDRQVALLEDKLSSVQLELTKLQALELYAKVEHDKFETKRLEFLREEGEKEREQREKDRETQEREKQKEREERQKDRESQEREKQKEREERQKDREERERERQFMMEYLLIQMGQNGGWNTRAADSARFGSERSYSASSSRQRRSEYSGSSSRQRYYPANDDSYDSYGSSSDYFTPLNRERNQRPANYVSGSLRRRNN